MKRFAKLLAVYYCLGVLCQSVRADIIILQPDGATGMDVFLGTGGPGTEFRANNNYGSSDGFVFEAGGSSTFARANGLIQFNGLPSLAPGQTVTSARLGLTSLGGTTGTVNLYRMTQSWVAGTKNESSFPVTPDGATWQTYDGVNPWPGISGFRTADGGGFSAGSAETSVVLGTAVLITSPAPQLNYINLDPSLVQQWLTGEFTNNGLLIVAAEGTGSLIFHSSDSVTAEYRPLLEITTSAVPEPSSFLLLTIPIIGGLVRMRRRNTSPPCGNHSEGRCSDLLVAE